MDSTLVTVTIPLNQNAAETALPRTLGSRYILESVKVKTRGRSRSQPVALSCDGTAYVDTSDVPLGSAITYSLQVPRSSTQAPLALSEEAYSEFLDSNSEGRDQLLTPLGALNETCRNFLREIAPLSPLERIEKIESFISLYGHYDFDNAEVRADKSNQSPEQIIAVMEGRALQLKRAGEAEAITEYAGVCVDFTLLYTAMLRESGIAAGIALGVVVDEAGKAKESAGHAKVFIPWVSDDPTDKGVRYLEREANPGNTPAHLLTVVVGDAPDEVDAAEVLLREAQLLQSITTDKYGEHISRLSPEQLKATVATLNKKMLPENVANVAALLEVAFFAPQCDTPEVFAAAVQHNAQSRGPEEVRGGLQTLVSDYVERQSRRINGASAPAISADSRTKAISMLEAIIERGRLALSRLEYSASIATLRYLSTNTSGPVRGR